jgi:hypothetical protein
MLLDGPAAPVIRQGPTMPQWVCGKCKTIVEGQVLPRSLPEVQGSEGAVQEEGVSPTGS